MNSRGIKEEMEDWVFVKPSEKYPKGAYVNRWHKGLIFKLPVRGTATLEGNNPRAINDHLNALALGAFKAKKRKENA